RGAGAVQWAVAGFLVGGGRATYGVPAPAMSGHTDWERLNRAHQNSLEQLVLVLAVVTAYLLRAGIQTGIAAGILFLIARILYAVGYIRDAKRREIGAWLT